MSADDTSPDSVAVRPAAERGRLRGALVLAGVFLLGGVAGLAAGRATANRELASTLSRPPDELRARMLLETMRRHLDLRDDQAEKLELVLTEAESERARLVAPCKPELDALRERSDRQVRELLDDEQRSRFDEFRERRKHGRFGGRRGAPPPGPPGRPPPPRDP